MTRQRAQGVRTVIDLGARSLAIALAVALMDARTRGAAGLASAPAWYLRELAGHLPLAVAVSIGFEIAKACIRRRPRSVGLRHDQR